MYAMELEVRRWTDQVPARSEAQDQLPRCLACGTRISRRAPTLQIGGALVHVRCAVYRRRMMRR